MKNVGDTSVQKFRSLEEEREYWEARGPLAEGQRGRLNRPSASVQRCSFLSVRMSGAEITQLRDLAMKFDCGPSTLARRVLVAFMDQMEELRRAEQGKGDKPVMFEEICKSLGEKMPGPLKERLENLLKSSLSGDRSFFLVDPSQMKEWQELSVKLISMLIETAAPSIKVITPYDSNYEKVKSAMETEKSADDFANKATV